MEYREAKLEDLPKLLEIEQYIVDAERPFNTHIKSGSPTYYDISELIRSSDSMVMLGSGAGRNCCNRLCANSAVQGLVGT